MPKAVRFHQIGGPENLKIEDVTLREPQEGEVAMDVHAVGMNRAESMYYHGQYGEIPTLPSGLGYEAFGTVTAVGPGGDASLIGKKFGTFPGYSQNRFPVLGEKAVVPAETLVALPESLSAVDAAASLMQYGTAWGALVELGKVGPGDFVIIPAASSSVGLAAIQIVKAQGATSIATTRTSAKKQQLLALGADHVIATEEEDLPARVQEITAGKLARITFDPVGGDYIATLADATAPEGTIFLYGLLSGQPTPYPPNAFWRSISLRGYILPQPRNPERFQRMTRYIHDHLADGTLKPVIAKTFPFAQVVEAYQYLESNQQVGKVVITL